MPTYGEIAYEAYRTHTEGKSVITGLHIPPWGSLADEVKAAWEAAGEEVSVQAAADALNATRKLKAAMVANVSERLAERAAGSAGKDEEK